MSPPRPITFRELVERVYTSQGYSTQSVLSIVHLGTGCSLSTIRAALRGSRILVESADKLTEWCARTHRTVIDRDALLRAPVRSAARAHP